MTNQRAEKYGFRVRTRNGAVVERVLISADSEEDARAKLAQMYQKCDVLATWRDAPAPRVAGSSFEELVDLLNDKTD